MQSSTLNTSHKNRIIPSPMEPTRRPVREPRWQRYVDIFLPICLSIVIGMGFGFSFSQAESRELIPTHHTGKKSAECQIYDIYVSEP